MGIRKPTFRKPETSENRTFRRSDFKRSCFQMVRTTAIELWSQSYENWKKHQPRLFYVHQIVYVYTKWSRLMDHLKSRLFGCQPEFYHLKSRLFDSLDRFIYKYNFFHITSLDSQNVWLSNGVWQPTYYWLFENWTCPDFGTPLYSFANWTFKSPVFRSH